MTTYAKRKLKYSRNENFLFAPLRWMGQIRNPRWEQKRTEGYVIVSTSNQTQNFVLTRCKMVRSEVFSWVNWIHKQHIDFMILLDRIYLEIAQNLFYVS